MESASPTATASTNRGGRPKDWTEPRTRRLIRLYLFTTLPFGKILDLLEEDEFKPGKDAANKVKNGVLGNDPRWIRPKDDEEEKTRIRGLRNSLRGRQTKTKQNAASQNTNIIRTPAEHDLLTPIFPENASLGGTTIAHSYRSSIEELHHPDFASLAYPDTHADIFTTTADEVAASRFIPSFLSRRNTSRQDTGLTTSTDISLSSAFREKLSFLPLDKMKRTAKVLKRYTFPKNIECERASEVSPDLFQRPEFHSRADGSKDPFNATHAVPGDFLNTELFAHRQRCAAESPAHAAGLCWCKIAEQLAPTQNVWATLQVPFLTSDPNLVVKDMFGNTVFHCLAAGEGIQDLFLHLACQALRDPRLPIRDSNTAGQTFLHVLHRSWFQEGSRLGELLDILRGENFNLLATDVYGRSFYHILRVNMRGSARFPGQAFDIYRINRRDAFGMKPMDSRSPPYADYPAARNSTLQGASTTSTIASTRPGNSVPRINTQAETPEEKKLRTHQELLKIVTSAVGVDGVASPNPREEDSQGRNGFHCLAEANLWLATQKPSSRGHSKDNPKPSPQGHGKRKHSEDEAIDVPRTAHESQRLELIHGLIVANVDVNQYDKQGNTPLMSFIINSSDATRWEKEESEIVIKALIQEASANIELRNRNGETALHLAARYGKTIPLKVLLELGANPHTRNVQGLSILQVLDSLYVTTERDDKNNARLEACRAILTRSPDYAMQSPTIIHEWATK
ncbi:hypothetical protein HD806DRAFT_519718 [Xylariaceae sp. AK1471]|nr:hypothetical protein HD806DRAFT_519718 [Xylariaceae sp. AK1471]